MKLYELAQDYNNLLEMLDNSDIPEDAIRDTLEAVQGEIQFKADNIACMLKSLALEVNAIKAEEEALSERRKQKQNQYDFLKQYLSTELLACNIDKMETARNKITFRASESLVVDDEDAFIADCISNGQTFFLSYPAPKIDKTAIKEALKSGEIIDGARIEKKSNIQIK